ncbi:unnamed protein product [Lepidochelys kempii]
MKAHAQINWLVSKVPQVLLFLLQYSPSNSYSPTIQGRFTASKDSSSFYLYLSSLKPEDTAAYYCGRDTARGNLLCVPQEPAASRRSMNRTKRERAAVTPNKGKISQGIFMPLFTTVETETTVKKFFLLP